jgi:hypothetical protein
MIKRPPPEALYRAHANTEGPLDPSSVTGGYRYDDFRVPAQFHVLYTGDSVEGCLIEKLQRYRGSDAEAYNILNAIKHSDGDTAVIPTPNQIPAAVLRNLAASVLRVMDVTRQVVQIDDLKSIMTLRDIGKEMGIDLPDLKPGDVLRTEYTVSQRLSVIIYEAHLAPGSASRSSLDSPSASLVHTNLNLYRDTPESGSEIYVPVERVETHRALDRYRSELAAAIAHLGAVPALPLDHPDMSTQA